MIVHAVIVCSFLCTASLIGVGSAVAHQLAPVVLDIALNDDGSAEIKWTTSAMMVRGARVEPVFPDHCFAMDAAMAEAHEDRVIQTWQISCGEAGLVGHRIEILGLETAYTDAVIRIEAADGSVVRQVLRASEPSMVVPERESIQDVFRSYMHLGIEHILTGWDHLAFVLGLLLLVRGFGLLVKTITAFTVGHSVTLTLTALGVAPFAPSPIEFGIAMSIFLLAVELARDDDVDDENRRHETLVRRFPWGIALAFGLLHGAGFAGALVEVGLPQNEIPLALFAFNVGIEVGQLTFIAAVMAAWAVLHRVLAAAPPVLRWVPVYALGCLSVYWCIDRGLVLFR
jgi:hypothetical protein